VSAVTRCHTKSQIVTSSLMSRVINLRSRLVDMANTVTAPESGDTAPNDTGSEHGSERAASPTPEIDDTHHLRDAPVSRRPSLETEDQNSPTRRTGGDSDLVRVPNVSTIDNNRIVEPERGQRESDERSKIIRNIPIGNPFGRGRGGFLRRPRRVSTALSEDQAAVVAAARAALTPEEQARIAQRQSSEVSSRGEGTSHQKGKGIDPRDLGGISFEPDEDDPDLQTALYQTYQDYISRRNEKAKKRNQVATDRDVPTERDSAPFGSSSRLRIVTSESPAVHDHSDHALVHKEPHVIIDRTDQPHLATQDPPCGLMPSKSIHPKSSIARTMQIGEQGNGDWTDESSDPSDSSDSSDSSSSDSSSKGRNERRKKRKKKSKRKVNVKPKEPTDYHGEIDRKWKHGVKCLKGWISITHVCHGWREVALNTSLLWCHIDIVPVVRGWIPELLRRSNQSPLTVASLN
jgi:hypothetical protein